ncbi:MAG: NB-ARC domain-containing protein, partial [Waterburya sp.]
MDWDEIVKVLDTKIFTQTQRHLKKVENIVLQGAWQGKTYEQMEETCQYSLSYLKQAAGPKLWKLLSEVFQEDISKTNFRVVLERQWEKQESSFQFKSELLPNNQLKRKQDWGEAPDIAALHGRDRELKLLKQWILGDCCRLVTI